MGGDGNLVKLSVYWRVARCALGARRVAERRTVGGAVRRGRQRLVAGSGGHVSARRARPGSATGWSHIVLARIRGHGRWGSAMCGSQGGCPRRRDVSESGWLAGEARGKNMRPKVNVKVWNRININPSYLPRSHDANKITVVYCVHLWCSYPRHYHEVNNISTVYRVHS